MGYSLLHIPEWHALKISQNGKNTPSVHDQFDAYLNSISPVRQIDNFNWLIHEDEFKNFMDKFGWATTMTQTEASVLGTEEPIIPDIDYKLKHKDKMKLPPFPFQEVGANFLISNERGVIGDEMGLGKAQPLNSLIVTPKGFKEMRDIKVSDEVYHPNGNVQKVLGVYPQGKEDVYRITFNDGSTAESSIDHLWTIQTRTDRSKGKWRTLTLEKVIELQNKNHKDYRIYTPVNKPILYPQQSFEVHPYLMGYLLSKGYLGRTDFLELEINSKNQLDIIQELVNEDVIFYSEEYENRFVLVEEGGFLYDELVDYELIERKKNEMFIPREYLIASYQQRVELLQGLLDGGGVATKNKVAEFNTTSETLINNIVELIQSLGGRAKPFVTETKHSKLYRLTITVPNEIPVFRVYDKAMNHDYKRKYPITQSIESIEYIGVKETQCIEVESKDGLYLTDNYITTHNTMSALTAFNDLYHEGKVKKALFIVPASLKYQWKGEVDKFTEFLAVVIDGTKKKRRELYDSFKDNLDNFAIISYETVRNDIDIVKELPFEVIVYDEAHRLKNRQTKLYKAMKQLKSQYLFMLTGTPMQNKLDELFALFKLIDKDILGDVTKFKKKHYLVGEKFGRRFIELGYQNLDEVREKTSPYIIRRTKKEVAPDLPERIYSKVYVDMGKAQRDLYKEIDDGFKMLQEEINDYYESLSEEEARQGKKHKSEDMILGYMYMLQATSNHPLQLAKSDSKMAKAYMPFIRKARNSAKLDELMDILRAKMDEGEKVVIFSQYVTMLEIIYNHIFTEFDFYPYVIHGGIKSENRNIAVEEFSEHPLRNIMLLSDAGNYGLVV